jgi:hypothetical protein
MDSDPEEPIRLGTLQSADTHQTAGAEDDIPKPPDGGYGWVCLACCFASNCFTWGIVSVSPMSIVAAGPKPSH